VAEPSRPVAALEAQLDHKFARPSLLAEALTHASTSVTKGHSYERLEFLGDRVLGLAIADFLIQRFPTETEGDLARRHAVLVSREALVAVARNLDLARYINVQPNVAADRVPESILADACEALLGALYLDAGLPEAARLVERLWGLRLDLDVPPLRDAKTELQEWVQARGIPLPTYRTVSTEGPSHEPAFTVEASIEGVAPQRAVARSKRAAEQEAARALLAEARRRDGH
jgi:ribonuclease-3